MPSYQCVSRLHTPATSFNLTTYKNRLFTSPTDTGFDDLFTHGEGAEQEFTHPLPEYLGSKQRHKIHAGYRGALPGFLREIDSRIRDNLTLATRLLGYGPDCSVGWYSEAPSVVSHNQPTPPTSVGWDSRRRYINGFVALLRILWRKSQRPTKDPLYPPFVSWALRILYI